MDSTHTEPAQMSPTALREVLPFQRRFRSIFTRHALYIALLVVLPVALSESINATLTLLSDPDLWWHLADARLLFATGHFIRTEPYAFSVAGQPWINPEWLAEVPYWLSDQAFGLRGIYLVTWLVIAANILLVYARGFARTRNADAAFWAAGLSFLLMSVNAGPRMIVLGYLALSVELLILEAADRGRQGLLWLLPLVFCVWINLHGTWVIGLALFVLYCATGMVRVHMGALAQDAFPSPDRKRLLTVLAVSVVALFVNPYGWRLIWSPIDMMVNQKLNIASVAEWQPLKMSSFGGVTLTVVLLVMVMANLKRGRTWKLYDLAVVFFAFYSAVDHVRFLFLAAVLIAPTLALDLARSFSSESNEKTIPAMNALIAASAVIYLAIMFPSESKLQKKLGLAFPLQTIRSLDPAWRTFNWDYLGGRMAFESRPPFIDSRLDTFEHHGVLQNYMAAMNLVDSFEILDHYQIDHVLVLEPQPIAYLLKHTPGWQLARREQVGAQTFVLFARVPGSSLSDPSAP